MAAAQINWTVRRCRQLEKLRVLLNEIKTLNNSNLFIDRTKKIMRIAKELSEVKWRVTADDKFQESFLRFLELLCIDDRKPIYAKRSKKRTE